MTQDILIALITFSFASSITPGPNNLMLMASGANYGIKRTIPHMLGISLGHAFMVAMVGVWVNPKAWFMAITAITNYAPQERGVWIGALTVAAVFAATNLPSVSVWAWLGVQVRRFLDTPARLRTFNITMAVLLLLSLWPVLQH